MALSKMTPPQVNVDILLEIIKEFAGGIDQYKENSGALSSFMVSGREPFNAALNYFSRADRINFRDFGLDICVKGSAHCFGYEWELLDILLKVSLPSVDHLCVYELPENDKAYDIMDQIMKNDLKHLTLFADLPVRYKYLLRHNYKFDTVYSQHLFIENTSLSEILLIPSESHKIIISNFGKFVNDVAQGFYLSDGVYKIGVQYVGVKNLIFDGCGFIRSDLCRKSLSDFSVLISELFPNLESFEAECVVYAPWFPMINTLLNTHFQWFNEVKGIPSKTKGKILFRVYDRAECIDRLRRLDGFFQGVIFNYDKSTMSKTFQIHEGFTAKWEIEFGLTFHTAREDLSIIDSDDETQSLPTSLSDTQSNASSTQSIYFHDEELLSETGTMSDIDDDDVFGDDDSNDNDDSDNFFDME